MKGGGNMFLINLLSCALGSIIAGIVLDIIHKHRH